MLYGPGLFIGVCSILLVEALNRNSLHKGGGMTSFIENLKALEGNRRRTSFGLRDTSVARFLDVDRVRNGPKFPSDLGIEFKEVFASKRSIKVYGLSDLHADAEKNQQWVKEHCQKTQDDVDKEVFSVFVIPGDIGSEVDRIESIFKSLCASHDAVCYVPGNHEAWRRGTQLGDSTSATEPEKRTASSTRMSPDSVCKIVEVVELAQACGVYTGPLRIVLADTKDLPKAEQVAVGVFPLYSWYHPGWDTEPDLEDEDFAAVEEAMPFARKWGDFSMCTWPRELVSHEAFCSTNNDPTKDSTVLAEAWASVNEPFLPPIEQYRGKGGDGEEQDDGDHAGDDPPRSVPDLGPNDTIISFSHFLPRQELAPEKRFLLEPLLSRVVGSDPLEAQVRRLLPHVHLYGHTHIPLDLELEGVRYIQWPLGYSREANMQCSPIRRHRALCVYDSSLPGDNPGDKIPPSLASLECAWSQYYRTQPRDAAIIAPLAPWVVRRLQSFAGFVKRPVQG